MKTWKNPEIIALDIKKTSQGGRNESAPDGNWTDQNGHAWTSFASGGSGSGDPIIINPTGDSTIDAEK